MGRLSTEEQRAWTALRTTYALLHQRMDHRLKRDAGVSHLQYEILARLAAAPERELRMTELACAVVGSKSGVTYQIGQLEQAGLVRRRTCPSDVRAVYAVLTEEGSARLDRAAPGQVDLVRELLVDVLTPEQLRAVADGLGEANRRMRDSGDHGGSPG
ncbi:MarR family transcriptional regulator [Amycolatopsis sp. NPDC005961]|uniref:Transcriptional regulator n=1 Tax=Amycolatopsis camponoti TaxID=2606593 RepID=A0A6I8LP25_9PSEU|nr:MarR family transcriptional regulator [Amycolatopsis camponoti]VVJ18198.1 Transcriptional regulator [Amycolatopsis camponoti]